MRGRRFAIIRELETEKSELTTDEWRRMIVAFQWPRSFGAAPPAYH
jgi:hypothetical protein